MNRTLLAGLCTALLCGCGSRNDNRPEDGAGDDRIRHRIEYNAVSIDTLRRGDFTFELISNGRLAAARRSELAFRTQGVIARIDAANGARIARGAVIARLDTVQQALQLQRARITLEKARMGYLDQLVGQGYRLGDTLTPPAELLRLARIRSGYADALTSLAEAQQTLDACTLRAPFAGKVADIDRQCYESPEGPFCTLLDDSRLRVRFTVLESEVGRLRVGQAVGVSPYADDEGREIAGRIVTINPTIDENGQVTVEAEVANDGTLLDGMNVRVAVRERIGGKLVVPKSAVVIRDNEEVLFRYRDGKALWTYVRTSLANSREYVVEANTDRGADLAPGDLIIVSGNLNLADGSEVTVAGSR